MNEVATAVVSPLPLYRRGLEAGLRDLGVHVEAPTDLAAWLERPRRVLLADVRHLGDIADLQRLPAARVGRVIALVRDESPAFGMACLSAGIDSVLDWAVELPALHNAVLQVSGAIAQVPANTLQQLVTVARRSEGAMMGPDDLRLLEHVARGATVARMADDLRFSQRTIQRRLEALTNRLGLEDRQELVRWAAVHGVSRSA